MAGGYSGDIAVEMTGYEARYDKWCGPKVCRASDLHTAAGTNNVKWAKELLKAGADVNEAGPEDELPIHHAARLLCLDTAMLLIDHGANVNALNSWKNTVLQYACFRTPYADNDGDANAARHNFFAMLTLLIRAGAEVETEGDGGANSTAMDRLKQIDADAVAMSILIKHKDIKENGLSNPERVAALLEANPDLAPAKTAFELLSDRFSEKEAEYVFESGHEFWFVDAKKIKESHGPLPKHQDMKRQRGWLRAVRIGIHECMTFVLTYCAALSYTWNRPDDPDPDGSVANVLRAWLREHPNILFVWIDWCSLPQAQRTVAEKAEFKKGLSYVNIVYLSCHVVKVMNSATLSRFWPQFEAWLSYRAISAGGFDLTLERSWEVFTGFAAKDKDEAASQRNSIQKRWSNASVEDVKIRLGEPEVTVTNLSDKDTQFKKIDTLATVIGNVAAES